MLHLAKELYHSVVQGSKVHMRELAGTMNVVNANVVSMKVVSMKVASAFENTDSDCITNARL